LQPVARSIRRFSSVPPCLRGEGWSGGLGRSPFQGSRLMGAPLTQAAGLGFVRSPLWGSKTASDLARLGFVRSPLWGSKTAADFARLGFVRATSHFPLKRGTKAVVAKSLTIHLALKRPSRRCAGSWFRTYRRPLVNNPSAHLRSSRLPADLVWAQE